jgi:hypothetical protein
MWQSFSKYPGSCCYNEVRLCGVCIYSLYVEAVVLLAGMYWNKNRIIWKSIKIQFLIDIAIFVNCNWVDTRWQKETRRDVPHVKPCICCQICILFRVATK